MRNFVKKKKQRVVARSRERNFDDKRHPFSRHTFRWRTATNTIDVQWYRHVGDMYRSKDDDIRRAKTVNERSFEKKANGVMHSVDPRTNVYAARITGDSFTVTRVLRVDYYYYSPECFRTNVWRISTRY